MTSEDGLGAVLLISCLAAATAVVLVVAATAGSVLLAAGRAQDAADAAALAAAHAAVSGGASAAVAAASATAMGAGGHLVACACTGPVVEVVVAVEVRAPAARAAGVTHQRATARAALVGVTVGGRPGACRRTLLARTGPARHLPGAMVVGSHTTRSRLEATHG